jgi:hypothetical protein
MKALTGGKGIALLIFNLGARWRWMVSATPQPLYTPERDPVPIVFQSVPTGISGSTVLP